MPATSGHGSTWFQQSQEAAAKQAQQDFDNAFKTVDAPRSRAAMANTTIAPSVCEACKGGKYGLRV